MINWIISVFVNTIVLMVIDIIFRPSFHLESVGACLLASIILSIFRIFIKPILVILTLPVTIVTLGLFLFVINAILLELTSAVMGDAFTIRNFGMALIASVIISVLTLLIQEFVVKPLRKKD
ncbi:phage holin family protein [Fictibacillus sp. Mic-4]|uniref:phage holin family protein n=1 Tax=Fictibacillus sp. Mic-4 TaxID=3132826 RepID=UPI003CFB4DCE